MREYVGCPRSPYEVAFVPGDPPRLAAASNAAAYVWPADGGPPGEYGWDETSWGMPVLAVSADGRWLAAGPGSRLRCWDLGEPSGPPAVLELGRTVFVRSAARGDRLLAAVRSGTDDAPGLIVRELSLRRPEKPRDRVLAVPPELEPNVRLLGFQDSREADLSADGRWFACCPPNERVTFLWEAARRRPPRRLHNASPRGLKVSPDGSCVAVDAGTTVYVYDTATLELVAKWKSNYSYSPRLAWSPDGRRLARTDVGATVRIFDPSTGQELTALRGKRAALISVAFSPDGLTLATGTDAGPVRVWDVD